jgi:hypothetical protein
MKLLYLGDNAGFCPFDTLQRLILLADEVCFLDRPSLKFDNVAWGTIGAETPMRRFSTGSEVVRFSSFSPPSGVEAGSIYEHYAHADARNPAFVKVFLDGLRDSDAFAHRYVQPNANYGNDVNGSKLRQLLVADSTLYQSTFDLTAKDHPSVMDQPETGEGRRAVMRTLLMDASIRITGAVLMADELDAVPIADDRIHPQLLALRSSNLNYVGGTPSIAPFLGLQFVRATIPDEALKRLDVPDLISYREKSKDIYAAWNIEISRIAAKIADADLRNPAAAVEKLIAAELMPKLSEYENEMASVRDKLFSDVIKNVLTWELPAVSIGCITSLNFTGALQAFVTSAALVGAAAGVKATVPPLVDYVTSRRAARRKHAVSYLLELTRR